MTFCRHPTSTLAVLHQVLRKNWLYRSGRTGRAGKTGTTIAMVTQREMGYFRKILQQVQVSALGQASQSINEHCVLGVNRQSNHAVTLTLASEVFDVHNSASSCSAPILMVEMLRL